MTGTEIEGHFVDYIEQVFHFEALKLRIDGQDGFPDRTVITPDGCFYIEFKSKHETVRPQQRRWKKRLQELGQVVVVVRSVDAAKDAFEAWLTGADPE
jgi:hypothetical protein